MTNMHLVIIWALVHIIGVPSMLSNDKISALSPRAVGLWVLAGVAANATFLTWAENMALTAAWIALSGVGSAYYIYTARR